MRYRVFGIDEDNGETVELTVEAESIGHAEERAAMRGFTAQRVERVEESSAIEAVETTPVQQQLAQELVPTSAPVSDEVFHSKESDARPKDGSPEQDIWEGGPSQLVNAKRYAQSLAIAALLGTGGWFLGSMFPDQTQQIRWIALLVAFVPGVVMTVWAWAHTRAKQFTLSSERIRCRQGIFTRKIEEIELYRVKDIEITQTLAQRMVRLGTVVLVTDDATCPRFSMASIPHYEMVRDRVRALVEKRRVERRFEVIGGGEHTSL
jgi:membrane protein YdbS with pleckstrin-like domain